MTEIKSKTFYFISGNQIKINFVEIKNLLLPDRLNKIIRSS